MGKEPLAIGWNSFEKLPLQLGWSPICHESSASRTSAGPGPRQKGSVSRSRKGTWVETVTKKCRQSAMAKSRGEALSVSRKEKRRAAASFHLAPQQITAKLRHGPVTSVFLVPGIPGARDSWRRGFPGAGDSCACTGWASPKGILQGDPARGSCPGEFQCPTALLEERPAQFALAKESAKC